jgi:hypothetical protein
MAHPLQTGWYDESVEVDYASQIEALVHAGDLDAALLLPITIAFMMILAAKRPDSKLRNWLGLLVAKLTVGSVSSVALDLVGGGIPVTIIAAMLLLWSILDHRNASADS